MTTDQRTSIFNIPNQLTLARLVLSVLFFIALTLFEYDVFGREHHTLVLNLAMAGFILAVSTDFLDGYLARKWGLVSTFGRIADPFVDKIIICGTFILLIEVSDFIHGWFAVVILFRELLISGLRSYLESQNIPFAASWSGKIKMIVQSIAIPCVLFYEANFSKAADSSLETISWMERATYYLTQTFLWLTILSTVLSCASYIRRAWTVLAEQSASRDASELRR
jgi:CDP-diacylglycerol--glycerol-3-phosphate 3-phosphatidyltransferase